MAEIEQTRARGDEKAGHAATALRVEDAAQRLRLRKEFRPRGPDDAELAGRLAQLADARLRAGAGAAGGSQGGAAGGSQGVAEASTPRHELVEELARAYAEQGGKCAACGLATCLQPFAMPFSTNLAAGAASSLPLSKIAGAPPVAPGRDSLAACTVARTVLVELEPVTAWALALLPEPPWAPVAAPTGLSLFRLAHQRCAERAARPGGEWVGASDKAMAEAAHECAWLEIIQSRLAATLAQTTRSGQASPVARMAAGPPEGQGAEIEDQETQVTRALVHEYLDLYEAYRAVVREANETRNNPTCRWADAPTDAAAGVAAGAAPAADAADAPTEAAAERSAGAAPPAAPSAAKPSAAAASPADNARSATGGGWVLEKKCHARCCGEWNAAREMAPRRLKKTGQIDSGDYFHLHCRFRGHRANGTFTAPLSAVGAKQDGTRDAVAFAATGAPRLCEEKVGGGAARGGGAGMLGGGAADFLALRREQVRRTYALHRELLPLYVGAGSGVVLPAPPDAGHPHAHERQWAAQDGACGVCGKTMSGGTGLHWDVHEGAWHWMHTACNQRPWAPLLPGLVLDPHRRFADLYDRQHACDERWEATLAALQALSERGEEQDQRALAEGELVLPLRTRVLHLAEQAAIQLRYCPAEPVRAAFRALNRRLREVDEDAILGVKAALDRDATLLEAEVLAPLWPPLEHEREPGRRAGGGAADLETRPRRGRRAAFFARRRAGLAGDARAARGSSRARLRDPALLLD
jgi:hypothetical protein